MCVEFGNVIICVVYVVLIVEFGVICGYCDYNVHGEIYGDFERLGPRAIGGLCCCLVAMYMMWMLCLLLLMF